MVHGYTEKTEKTEKTEDRKQRRQRKQKTEKTENRKQTEDRKLIGIYGKGITDWSIQSLVAIRRTKKRSG